VSNSAKRPRIGTSVLVLCAGRFSFGIMNEVCGFVRIILSIILLKSKIHSMMQRTDSTPVVAAMRALNRAALNALATVAPERLRDVVPPA
jgi:hypothetical protein